MSTDHAKDAAQRIQEIDFNEWTPEFPGIAERVIQKAIDKAVADERNACAEEADRLAEPLGHEDTGRKAACFGAGLVAAAIRARN